MPIRGLIFDLDGTLVDSRLDFEAIRAELQIPRGTAILEALESLEGDAARRGWEILERHEQAGAERARLMPGVEAFMAHAQTVGWPLAVLTRNSRRAALATLERCRLTITQVIAREDAPPKPDPTAIEQLVAGWELSPREVAVVGDYHFDLEAARRANARPVWYSAGRTVAQCPWAAQAEWTLECFTQVGPFLAWLEQPDAAANANPAAS